MKYIINILAIAFIIYAPYLSCAQISTTATRAYVDAKSDEISRSVLNTVNDSVPDLVRENIEIQLPIQLPNYIPDSIYVTNYYTTLITNNVSTIYENVYTNYISYTTNMYYETNVFTNELYIGTNITVNISTNLYETYTTNLILNIDVTTNIINNIYNTTNINHEININETTNIVNNISYTTNLFYEINYITNNVNTLTNFEVYVTNNITIESPENSFKDLYVDGDAHISDIIYSGGIESDYLATSGDVYIDGANTIHADDSAMICKSISTRNLALPAQSSIATSNISVNTISIHNPAHKKIDINSDTIINGNLEITGTDVSIINNNDGYITAKGFASYTAENIELFYIDPTLSSRGLWLKQGNIITDNGYVKASGDMMLGGILYTSYIRNYNTNPYIDIQGNLNINGSVFSSGGFSTDYGISANSADIDTANIDNTRTQYAYITDSGILRMLYGSEFRYFLTRDLSRIGFKISKDEVRVNRIDLIVTNSNIIANQNIYVGGDAVINSNVLASSVISTNTLSENIIAKDISATNITANGILISDYIEVGDNVEIKKLSVQDLNVSNIMIEANTLANIDSFTSKVSTAGIALSTNLYSSKSEFIGITNRSQITENELSKTNLVTDLLHVTNRFNVCSEMFMYNTLLEGGTNMLPHCWMFVPKPSLQVLQYRMVPMMMKLESYKDITVLEATNGVIITAVTNSNIGAWRPVFYDMNIRQLKENGAIGMNPDFTKFNLENPGIDPTNVDIYKHPKGFKPEFNFDEVKSNIINDVETSITNSIPISFTSNSIPVINTP